MNRLGAFIAGCIGLFVMSNTETGSVVLLATCIMGILYGLTGYDEGGKGSELGGCFWMIVLIIGLFVAFAFLSEGGQSPYGP